MTGRITGAEAAVRMLRLHGVTHVFGLCGDTSLPFYDALARSGDAITHVLTRDERHAAYMADGYARVTGRPGVCEGPSGGGATYILPGLVEANESSIPVLAITTDVATTSRGRYPLTELDQESLFRPLTKWNATAGSAARLPAMMRRAFREMTTGRPGSAQLTLPFDTQLGEVPPEEIWAHPRHGSFPAERAAPDPAAVRAAADILAEARSAVAVCGGGVVISGAERALARLAALLDLPVATGVSGQGSVADTDPLAVGVVGSNGGVPSTRAVVEEADTVLFVGCRAGSVTTEKWRVPAAGKRIIHIDSDPAVIGANYETEAPVCADAHLALEALAEELGSREGLAGQDGRRRAGEAWRAKLEAFGPLAHGGGRPIRPEAVAASLMEVLDEDATLVADPGTPCPYLSAHYRCRRAGRRLITNRAHGALGYSLPAAMGAHLGRPGVKTVAVMGDGSFNFFCGELETLVRHRMPVMSVVVSNSSFGWIKAGQKAGFGGRYHNVDFGRTDHAAVARAFGVESWTVEDPDLLVTTLREALGRGAPTLVDVIAQPLEEAAAPVSEWMG